MLAAAFLMSCTMTLLAQMLHAFGIQAGTGSSAFYLPLEFFFLAESLAYLTGLVLPPFLLLKMHGICLQEAVPMEKTPVPLQLKEAKTYKNGAVWLRYLV